jgi:hypothetical protein
MSAAANPTPTLWVRPEDADHPKLARLQKALTVTVGPEGGLACPWLVWAAGLTRDWLRRTLESGAQVLLLPPWSEDGFAGLPAIRTAPAPSNKLQLSQEVYTVAASAAIEPGPAWREEGVFAGSKLAWLVAHEPFVGAGFVWLCSAELLVASPNTRPKDARDLLVAVVNRVQGACRGQTREAPPEPPTGEAPPFTPEDVPYLLALLGVDRDAKREQIVEFVERRLYAKADPGEVERMLARADVQAALARPKGDRSELARAVDALGYRSFRLEVEETF